MASANVDRQVLRQVAVSIDNRLVKHHMAIDGVEHGGMVRVIQHHQLCVVLFTCRANAAALDDNFVA